MLFQILCAGGCGDDLEPIKYFFLQLLKLVRFLGPLTIAVIGVVLLVMSLVKKNKKSKARRNKGLKLIIISLIAWHVLTLSLVAYNSLIIAREYDEGLQCWCK